MNKSLRVILMDARVQIIGVLLLVWIAAILKKSLWQSFVFPLYAVILFSTLDLLFTYRKTKKWYYPFSSVVSGLLIGFLIRYSEGFITITAAVFLAFLSKHFLKIKNRHIFNPAAFGVVLATLAFGSSVSWWAVASGGILLPIIAVSVLILYKLRRLSFTITFLAGYFLYFTLLHGIKTATALTLDGTVFLFAFIMLTEPMTSSITKFWKWSFGTVVLAGVVASFLLRISFTDPLLISLLFTNLLVRITGL